MAGEAAPLDLLASGSNSLEAPQAQADQVPQLLDLLEMVRLGAILGLSGQERHPGREQRRQEELAFEDVVADGDDPHDEMEPKECFAHRLVRGSVDLIAGFALHSAPCGIRRRAPEPVDRRVVFLLLERRSGEGVDPAMGMGLGRPGDGELGPGQGTFDR